METTKKTSLTTTDGKSTSIIAYLTLVGLIIAFIINTDKKNEYTAFHIRQSLGLGLTGICLAIIGLIPILGWILNVTGVFILLYMWIIGLVNAINEKEKPVPILGNLYAEWFKNL